MTHNKQHITFLRTAVACLFLTAFLCRCATIGTPTGGPKDSLPPVIVALNPDNFSTNRPLTGHERIYIEFDEFIQIKDQQKEFFTSPAMKKKPLITQKGKGIVIQLRDTLEPNTTYALNFGGSIRDNNEGNPLNSMRYVFSTGETCDSMIVSGYTADSYKADSVSKSFIWFFAVDSVEQVITHDSTLFKYKPDVIARAENNGIFIAQNLKPIPYRVYAIEDTNDNQMYEPSVDQVGFLTETPNPAELPDFAIWHDSLRRYISAEPQLYFRMFTDRAFRRHVLQDSHRPLQHKAELFFTGDFPEILSLKFDSVPDSKIIREPVTENKDTLYLWFNAAPEELPDTIKGEMIYMKHDTANILRPDTVQLKLSWRKIESREEEKERERLERERKKAEAAGEEWKEPKKPSPFKHTIPTKSDINPEEHLWADFDYPLTEIDSARILLTRTLEDGTIEDRKLHFVRDTASLRRYQLRSDWQTEGTYTLTIPEGALTNIAGEKNDSLVATYTVFDPEKFATLLITVKSSHPTASYIIQQLDASGRLKQEKRDVKGGSTVQLNYVATGEIQIRIVEDMNSNGRWDTGNVVEMRQPERTELYADEKGETLIATKANWEIELTIDMDKLFAPVTMQSLQEMLDEREMRRLEREWEKRMKEGPKRDNHGQNSSGFGFGSGGGAMNMTGNMFNSYR
ncbi:MAG: Ig-like domain-containing protein [Rikenellaceae bacterium]|nr:Ig-like domain-containing protein [Rikenellaceae bacterium]